MCGIFGSPTITPSVRAMLPYLGLQMQSRGRDAWGASDGEAVLKHKGALVDTWAAERELVGTWPHGIFHTRGASHGTPREEENAHPFLYPKADGTTVIGIHNGLVSNHVSLAAKYQRECPVDSQHLWMHRAAGRDWSDISGWGNLAWWETSAGHRRLNLCRFNTDSLKVARLTEGEFVFASEQAPITAMAQMLGNPVKYWVAIDEYYHYWFQPGDDGMYQLWRGNKLDFAKLPPPVHAPQLAAPLHHPGGRHTPWINSIPYCYACNTVRCGKEDEVLCFSCLRMFVTQYEVYGKDAGVWHDVPMVDSGTQRTSWNHTTEAHIRLKPKGSVDKVKLFHYLLGKLDPDYPFAPTALRRYPSVATCDTCHGAVYYSPMITPAQIRDLAKQVNECKLIPGNFSVRVLMFNTQCPGGKCTGAAATTGTLALCN